MLRHKIQSILIFLSLAASFCWLFYMFFNIADTAVKKEMHSTLSSISRILPALIDVEAHYVLEKETFNIIEYERLLGPLKAAVINTQDISYIYTVRKNKRNQIEFVLMTHSANELGLPGGVQIFDVYENPPPELLHSLDLGEPTFTAEPYTDSFGTFFSAYSPIKDSKGNIIGAIGVDISHNAYQQKIKPVAEITVYGVFFGLICSLLVAASALVIQDFSYRIDCVRKEAKVEVQ